MFPESLLTVEVLIAALLAFLGGIIRGYTGFGTPLLLAPVYALLFGPAAAVPLLHLQEVVPVLQTVRGAWPHRNTRELLSLLAGSIVMLPIGVYALSVLDPDLVRTVMSILSLIFVALLWAGWRYRGPRTLPVRIGIGGLSGFTSGLAGIGGPLVVLYYVSGEKNIAALRANLVVYFAGLTLISLPSLFYAGLITAETLWRCAVFMPPLFAGTAIGSRLFRGATEKRYVRAALLVLAAGAVIGLLR